MRTPSTRVTYVFLGLLALLTIVMIVAAILDTHTVYLDNEPWQVLHGAP